MPTLGTGCRLLPRTACLTIHLAAPRAASVPCPQAYGGEEFNEEEHLAELLEGEGYLE